ncbi:hypothetical protein ACFL3C_02055 [Patescibacteria group bacterium]
MKVFSKVTLFTLVAGLLAFGAGCGGEGLPAGKSPEDVITEALLNSEEVTKSVFEMSVVADLKGDVDGEKNDLKGEMKISGTNDVDAGTMQIAFSVDGSMNDDSVEASLELRANKDGVFAKIGKVKVSDSDVTELIDALDEEGYIGDWLNLSFISSEDLMQGGFGEVDYTEGDDLPFTNIEYKGTKDVLGINSYYFAADIDKEMFVGMMETGDLADAEEFFDAAEISGEVYVAVKENLLTGFAGKMKLDDKEMNGTMDMSFMINPTKSSPVSTPDAKKEITEEDIAMLMFGGAMMDPGLELDDEMMVDDLTGETIPYFDGEEITDEEAMRLLEEMEAELEALEAI